MAIDPKSLSLAKRIERIIFALEFELDGEAYVGKYELNNKNSIEKYINKLRIINGKNIIYTNLDTGEKIILSGNSVGKIAGHFKDGIVYQKSLIHIPKVIENMMFLDNMVSNKIKLSFQNYSYFITPVSMDSNSYTILSTIGYMGNEVYYDHNVFEGNSESIFENAKTTTDIKYSRLKYILQNTK